MKYLHTIALIVLLSGCSSPVPSKVVQVNDVVNRYRYVNEKDDIWKTPEQFYRDGGGDCEDFAIAKCELLRDEHDVKLLVAVNTSSGIAHAVLLVDEKFVLDNVRKDVYDLKTFNNNHLPLFLVEDCGSDAIDTIKGSGVRR